MNLIRKIGIVFVLMVFIGSFILSLYYADIVDKQFNYNRYELKNGVPPKYHFITIADNLDTPFWNAFKKGAKEAADEEGVVLEVRGTSGVGGIDESIRFLDMAIASKVDGLIVYALQKDSLTPYINKADEKGIPVITVEADAQKSNRRCFVGTNDFELGRKAGEMMIEATKGQGKVAIILQGYVNEEYNISNNLKLEGFMDAIDGYREMEVVTVKTSDLGIFSGEDITQDILQNYPEVDAVFCTSAKDTIGATQVIIDFNKVGDVTIIGYDDLPDILNYIDKEVVYGVVVRDPRAIGYESVKNLTSIKEGKHISTSITTDVYVVNKDNIDEYKARMGFEE